MQVFPSLNWKFIFNVCTSYPGMIKNDQNKNLLKNKLELVQNEKFIRGQNKLKNKSGAYYENC